MSDADNKLADEIYQVLLGYKCAFTQIEGDGGPMPLVDLLSPGKTIEEGREECSELAAEIAEAISRHFAGLAEEWPPIETAPKDGTPILLYRRGQYTGYYGGADSGWRFNDPLKTGMWPLPTHWRPLPPPPKEAEHD